MMLYCAGVSMNDVNVKAWMQRIERPAVQRGIEAPESFSRETRKDPKKVQEAIVMVRQYTETLTSCCLAAAAPVAREHSTPAGYRLLGCSVCMYCLHSDAMHVQQHPLPAAVLTVFLYVLWSPCSS